MYTICLSQQSDQGLHSLSFSAVWSRSTLFAIGERGGSVVECQTPEQEFGGSKPTAAVICPWARHFTPQKYWLITQEALAPSRHDWKIVDWDVKPQHKQTNKTICHSQSRSTLSFSGTLCSGSTLFTILGSLIKVYTVCHSQQPVQGLHYFPLSTVWSGSTLLAILNSRIRVYTIGQS